MESIEDMYMTASNKNEMNLQIMTTPSSYYLKLADTPSVVTLYYQQWDLDIYDCIQQE